jgi:hypothetical protein
VNGEDVAYQYRPRMLGSDHAFRLTADSLEWNIAGHAGRAAYPMIARVRLGYRPSNLGAPRFIAEIWPRNGPRIEIASTSSRSLVATEDQGPAYRAFVRELHRRIAAAGGECRFESGFAAWRWWPMAAIGVATVIGFAFITVRTIASADLAAAALMLALLGLLGWQTAPLILRNRPQRYEPGRIPDDVLPGGGSPGAR